MTIWKFQLQVNDVQSVEMPKGARILKVEAQRDVPCLWALVDPDAPKERREFRTIGTGHRFNMPPTSTHHGTYQLHDGALVFHVFEWA